MCGVGLGDMYGAGRREGRVARKGAVGKRALSFLLDGERKGSTAGIREGCEGRRERILTGYRAHGLPKIEFGVGLCCMGGLGKEHGGLTGFPSLWVSLVGVFFFAFLVFFPVKKIPLRWDWRGTFVSGGGNMVMHVLGTLFRERCPGAQLAYVLCCMQSALEIFCSQGPENAMFRNLAFGFSVGETRTFGVTGHFKRLDRMEGFSVTKSVM